MKLKVDEQADALYLSLGEAPSVQSDEVAPGIIVDYDAEGRAVGIEFLHLSKRAAPVEVHPPARANVDAQIVDALAHRLHIAQQP